MTEKICDFCGEPIAGGLQEHDFATCAHNLKDKVAHLEAALIEIRPKMFEAQEMMRTNGFVIDDLDDRWQKLAFTLYNYLVKIYSVADNALGGES